MVTLPSLHPFFAEFAQLSSLLHGIVPQSNINLVDPSPDCAGKASDEVFSGLPTAHNCSIMVRALSNFAKSLTPFTNPEAKITRSLLTRIELAAVLASSYNLVEIECNIWDSMFLLSRRSGRIVDACYALTCSHLARLISHEAKIIDQPDELKAIALAEWNKLSDYQELLDAVHDISLTGQFPTLHARFQSVIISICTIYLKQYLNWPGFCAQMDLLPLRYQDFFVTKSWAAVCARGYFYWIYLHARCLFGSTKSDSPIPESRSAFMNDLCSTVSSLPDSMVHAAVIVRMHGRTLVQFVSQCCEQKLASKKENKENVPHPDRTKVIDKEGSSKTLAWGSTELSDAELLNLWLGTRLLVLGGIQVAELYTLSGSVREARAYQEELLRIAQRFHLPHCAQTAVALMAYLDAFAQRKWAFDLRLRQLNHIATCKIPLSEIASTKNHQRKSDLLAEDTEDASFLHSDKNTELSTRREKLIKAEFPGFEDEAADTLSVGTNPLISANNGDFSSIFPCSPTRSKANAHQSSFPSASQLLQLLYGTNYQPDNSSVSNLDDKLISLGALPLTVCAQRILNAVNWPWLNQIVHLVRDELLPRAHFLPAAMRSLHGLTTKKVQSKDDDVDTDSLVAAFSTLTTSPQSTATEKTSSETIPPQTADSMPPPPVPRLAAPRRLADRRDSPEQDTTVKPTRSRRRKPVPDKPNVMCTPASRRSAVPRQCQQDKMELARRMPKGDVVESTEDDLILKPLGFQPAPRKPRGRAVKKIEIYVDDAATNSEDTSTDTRSTEFFDAVESCSSLAGVPPRPRNVRLASKWRSTQSQGLLETTEPSSTPNADFVRISSAAEASADQLVPRLLEAYAQLSTLPIPNLVRPICQWLGLRYLSKGNQSQAGRYFSQAVGIAPTTLYASILSSRLSESKTSSSITPSPSQLDRWFLCYRRICESSMPNDPFKFPDNEIESTFHQVTVIQLCIVDELAMMSANSSNGPPACLPFGLGARSGGLLVATKITGVNGTTCEALRAESRIMHGFTTNGLKMIDAFDELQVESLDSMQVKDRVQYWRTRYKLNDRLETLLSEMRRDWFSANDLKWLLTPGTESSSPHSIVLILDRRLIYLPWEWILSGDVQTNQPPVTITRSFSLPLVLSHLTALQLPEQPRFDPHKAFYVLNPEANLSFTQQMFQPLFEALPTWSGVTAREPSVNEVNAGFTEHDMFIYLGHGNGSRFLLHTFNQGLNARAVALVLGCSSGKPRWEGRHEPYSSLYNHLLAGCPFVAGLLWDVTDRDVDRFTQQFLTQWLFASTQDEQKSLGKCLAQATCACKLKHLVGKSVIVYGVSAEPLPDRLMKMPTS